MAQPETHEEIDRCLDALAAEYTNTAKGNPRRTEIENVVSALCLRRYTLPKFMDAPDKNAE